jgi:hypothetical protein
MSAETLEIRHSTGLIQVIESNREKPKDKNN